MDSGRIARLTHYAEQLGEAAKPIAHFLAVFHRSLVREGFSREEALELVKAMEQTLLKVVEGRREAES